MLTQRKATVAKPTARFENLVVTETADEVLLYDTDKHHIHHLNATTAAVWRLCDGQHTVVDLAREAGAELGAAMDEATVRLALTKLDDAGLLKGHLIDELRMSRMSRRTFMQRAGVAGAIAVPAIVSTTAAVGASFSAPGCGESCDSYPCVDPACPCIASTSGYTCQPIPATYCGVECTSSDQCQGTGSKACTTCTTRGTSNKNINNSTDTIGQCWNTPLGVIPCPPGYVGEYCSGQNLVGGEGFAAQSAARGGGSEPVESTVGKAEEIQLTPALSLDINPAEPGTTVYATISGFADGELVSVSFNGVGVGSANNDGSVPIDLTGVAGGSSYPVDAKGSTSGVSAPTVQLQVAVDTSKEDAEKAAAEQAEADRIAAEQAAAEQAEADRIAAEQAAAEQAAGNNGGTNNGNGNNTGNNGGTNNGNGNGAGTTSTEGTGTSSTEGTGTTESGTTDGTTDGTTGGGGD